MRRSTFTVDAESVQGNAGATATFHCVTIGEHDQWRKAPDTTDQDLMEGYLMSWTGFVDDDNVELPSPDIDSGVFKRLYPHERRILLKLFLEGPEGESAKN